MFMAKPQKKTGRKLAVTLSISEEDRTGSLTPLLELLVARGLREGEIAQPPPPIEPLAQGGDGDQCATLPFRRRKRPS